MLLGNNTNRPWRLIMNKMDFIRALTIACLTLTNTALAEEPYNDDALAQEQLAFADNEEYVQQRDFAYDEQAAQQQAFADDNPSIQQQNFADNGQASQPQAFPDNSQSMQQAFPDDTQPAARQTIANKNQSIQQAFADDSQPIQQQAIATENQAMQQAFPDDNRPTRQQRLTDNKATITDKADVDVPAPQPIQQEFAAANEAQPKATQPQQLTRKQVVAIANASESEKRKTADEISSLLQGNKPEASKPAIKQAEINSAPMKHITKSEPQKTSADTQKAIKPERPKASAAKIVDADSAPADLKNIKHIILHSKDKFAYKMDCYIKSSDVLCKGSLNKQPANFKSYESTLIGKLATTSTIKGNVSSFTKISGSKAGKACDTTNETNWPMTIKLSANHEAIMETGPVKSYTSIKGNPNCTGASEQTYPGKKVSMKWRAIG